jgi:hypothetical protein
MRARLSLLRQICEVEGGQGVKKLKKKTRDETPEPIAPEPAAPIEMEALREKIKNLVCAQAVEMVTQTIAQVGKGHSQGMKYLFEMIGLFPATESQETHDEDSLAGMLLRRLGIPEERAAEPPRRVHRETP